MPSRHSLPYSFRESECVVSQPPPKRDESRRSDRGPSGKLTLVRTYLFVTTGLE